jgi:CHAD domain-containing protein
VAPSHSEVRRRYALPAGADVPGLDQVPGVERVQTQDIEQEATYFDTDALDLAAVGITVRRRTGGDDEGWQLELPLSGEGERHELRLPLSRAVRSPPKRFRDAVIVHTRGRTLKKVADVRTHRTLHTLQSSDGQVLAYIRDDHVTAPTLPPSDAGLLLARREWEVALVDGPADLLDAADGLVRAAGATRVTGTSTLNRVLLDRISEQDGEALTREGAEGAAAAVVLARLEEQLAEMKRLDAQVRLDLPDSVHQMRVAMRRLRSALATFRPLLDADTTQPLRDELRWVGRVLGAARDAEVMHERLRALVAAEPAELVLGGVVSRIDIDLGDRYRHAYEKSLEALCSDRYFALVDGLEELVSNPAWTDKALEPAEDVLPGPMRNDWRRLRRRVDAAEVAGDVDRDARLHEARKAAKRARYAAESLEPVYGNDAERFARAAKKVQSALGEHQDSVVTLPLLRQLGVQAYLDGDNGFTFGRLHALEQARAQEALGTFAAAGDDIDRTVVRRWFS